MYPAKPRWSPGSAHTLTMLLLSPVIPEQGRAQLTPKCLEECLEYGREGGAEHLLLREHTPCLNFADRMNP